jgi:hypothetical protein
LCSQMYRRRVYLYTLLKFEMPMPIGWREAPKTSK